MMQSMLKQVVYLQNYKCKFSIYFFNNDISFNITCTMLKLYLLILEYVLEGTVSQILYLGPSFYSIKYRKCYPFFFEKIKRP